jgi:ketosteroid isomerase-like protein
MHANEQLIRDLFANLNAHDADAMINHYADHATFRDIAFELKGKPQIHAMWAMICSDNEKGPCDIVAELGQITADDTSGRAVVVESYTYRDTPSKVRNEIVSTFDFSNGKIVQQNDTCDPASWAKQAFGGSLSGWIAGHIGFIRRMKAMKKVRSFRPEAFR